MPFSCAHLVPLEQILESLDGRGLRRVDVPAVDEEQRVLLSVPAVEAVEREALDVLLAATNVNEDVAQLGEAGGVGVAESEPGVQAGVLLQVPGQLVV